MKTLCVLLLGILAHCTASAARITATPADYTGYLNGLVPGDTLYLTAGIYTEGLSLKGRSGTAEKPIVIMGVEGEYTTVLTARSCCNTISITLCQYLVIRNMKVDGLNLEVDAVKAEGTSGNWAHHITLENLLIVNHGANQQIVGISTKCSAWGWVIRRNTIIGAGTGLYLGNSNGEAPFVNGLIENNLVLNSLGYDMQIKHQLNTVRAAYPGTAVDSQVTIIRYNVMSKESGASTGADARPVLLLGAFPSAGFGENDRYEVYGNFFYENPVEAMLQVTGNTALYANVVVNHQAAAGYRTVYVTSQNGFQPRNIVVFHNTVLANAATGGIRLYGADPAYMQECTANAVFTGQPVSGFLPANVNDNITDTYPLAVAYVQAPSSTLSLLNLYPLPAALQGAATGSARFAAFTDFDKDFNGRPYDWTYRGAYSGSGVNPGWKLQLALREAPATTTGMQAIAPANDFLGTVYPNPASGHFALLLELEHDADARIALTDAAGRVRLILHEGGLRKGMSTLTADAAGLERGFYLLTVRVKDRLMVRKLLLEK